MNTLDAIFSRRSVRKFKDEKLSEEAIHTILKAGMSGPTCVNARDWSFIVVDDLTLLKQMADANGKPAKLLEKAPLAILICGDTSKAFKMAKDYWIIDGAIAGQNMILAAQDLGIGSVWLGTYPHKSHWIKDYWMPNKDWEHCNVDDPSARVLINYGKSGK